MDTLIQITEDHLDLNSKLTPKASYKIFCSTEPHIEIIGHHKYYDASGAKHAAARACKRFGMKGGIRVEYRYRYRCRECKKPHTAHSHSKKIHIS